LECAALVLNKDMQVHHPIALKWLQDLIIMSPTADFKRDDILHAHYLLGLCYEKGFGVRPDSMLAFKYYAIASITDIDARLALARFFYRGTLFQTNSDLGLFLIYSAYLQNHNIMDQIQDIFQNNAQVADLE